MRFKFRTRVKVKSNGSRIVRPDGVQTQSEFFDGTEGIVIRHDDAKGGYLCVLDCPEVRAAFGETITAYFQESELEAIPLPLYGNNYLTPSQALPGPFEFDSTIPHSLPRIAP